MELDQGYRNMGGNHSGSLVDLMMRAARVVLSMCGGNIGGSVAVTLCGDEQTFLLGVLTWPLTAAAADCTLCDICCLRIVTATMTHNY